MDRLLWQKLSTFGCLSEADRRIISAGLRGVVRSVPARREILRQGEIHQQSLLILNGWAARIRTLEDGRQQIVSLLVPGDLCDVDVFTKKGCDFAVCSVTPLSFMEFGRDRTRFLMSASQSISEALWQHALMVSAVQREWIVNMGLRSATERLAHLFCELYARLQAAGRTRGNSCEMPLIQADLAAATGLTAVHVNRTLKQLREDELITFGQRELTFPNLAALQNLACFSDDYLQLPRQARQNADPFDWISPCKSPANFAIVKAM